MCEDVILGGLGVSVLAIGAQVHGFRGSEVVKGDRFFNGDENLSTLHFGGEINLSAPYCKILRLVKELLKELKRFFVRQNSSLPSLVPSPLLLDGSYRISRELCWMDQ
jgi:hypothetical protein